MASYEHGVIVNIMSNTGMIHEERAANTGNFLVGRLLLFREKDQ